MKWEPSFHSRGIAPGAIIQSIDKIFLHLFAGGFILGNKNYWERKNWLPYGGDYNLIFARLNYFIQI